MNLSILYLGLILKYIYTLQQNFNYAILMELFYFMLIVQIQLKVILLQLANKLKGKMYN